MSKKNKNVPAPEQETRGCCKAAKKKKKKGGAFGRFLRRFFLLLLTIIVFLAVDLYLVLNLVFNGPSQAACETVTMSLSEMRLTQWIPGMFLGADRVAEIRENAKVELPENRTDASRIAVDPDSNAAQWANDPSGVRLETRTGDTFQAHVMLVRDPAAVSMGLASKDLSAGSGVLLADAMAADANMIAAVTAGTIHVDEATGNVVPAGLIYADGEKCWDENHNLVPQSGFAGFNKDHILIVATSMTAQEAEALEIRDGCSFGPVLIVNGEINVDAYNHGSGYGSRTAIGQKADGTVVLVSIDGLQAGSLGATYQDLIDILMEYEVVNACNMDGTASTMMYRDAGQVRMVSSDSLLPNQESRMPNYWMVGATGKE